MATLAEKQQAADAVILPYAMIAGVVLVVAFFLLPHAHARTGKGRITKI